MKVKLYGSVVAIILSACSSSDKVKEIDTKLDQKGSVDSAKIGINDDGKAIVQEEVRVDDELRSSQWANTRLEEKLNTEHSELKRCREDLSDRRLGGTGEVREIPEIDGMKSGVESKEEMGLAEDGELKIVKRQDFNAKLASERKYTETLRQMLKTVEKHRAECDRTLRGKRVEAGLPAERYNAEGHFDNNGTWIQTRRKEVTIDDGFEIRAKQQAKGNSADSKPAE